MPAMFAFQSRFVSHLVGKGLSLSLLLSPRMLRCSARCYLHPFPVACLDTFWIRFGHALDTLGAAFPSLGMFWIHFGHHLDTLFWTRFGHYGHVLDTGAARS